MFVQVRNDVHNTKIQKEGNAYVIGLFGTGDDQSTVYKCQFWIFYTWESAKCDKICF